MLRCLFELFHLTLLTTLGSRSYAPDLTEGQIKLYKVKYQAQGHTGARCQGHDYTTPMISAIILHALNILEHRIFFGPSQGVIN